MASSLLDKAIRLAAEAHAGQTEKNGSPYVLHPLRLMFRMSGELEMAAAVLHDVVEDTDWTLERLSEAGFPRELVEALDCLTHRPGESYARYVRRAAANPVARRVKLADLEDNLDLRRLPALTGKDLARSRRYHQAWRLLREQERSRADRGGAGPQGAAGK